MCSAWIVMRACLVLLAVPAHSANTHSANTKTANTKTANMKTANMKTANTKTQADVTPLQKLLQMMDEMLAKAKGEKTAEQVEFAKFQAWCGGLRKDKTTAIAEAKEQIEKLETDIEKGTTDAKVLAEEIKEHEAKMAKDTEELKEATSIRKKEAGDYFVQHKDLSESIDATERAISVLMTRKEDVPQSLAQVQQSRLVPASAKAVIKSFLSFGSESALDMGAPEANAYAFQSGGVVKLLEKLLAGFKKQLLAVEKEEMAAKAAYEQLKQELTDDITFDGKEIERKTKAKADNLDMAAAAKSDLASTKTTLADDDKVLADTLAECAMRSEEFEQNQVTRAEEIRAIETAVKILSSDDVKGNADTHLPSLLQLRSTSLVQATIEMPISTMARRRAVEFLQSQAHKLGSRALLMVADRTASDPFGKVKKMIKEMIVKLMEETNAEADQHAYCTTELATNKQTRENKQEEADELNALIEKLDSESAKLKNEVADLSDAIASIKKEQTEATKIRQEEKAANTKTIADAKAAIAGVEKATKLLKDFYGKAADGSLLQSANSGGESLREEMKAIERAPYKGMQAGSGGVFGMLEVVLSDFSRLLAETSHAEGKAASTYEKFMNESEENVAVMVTEAEHKTTKRNLADEKSADAKKELALTGEELDKAKNYHDKLKDECVDTGLSYEDRKKAREEEIDSLKEALLILEQQDLS